MIRRREEFRIKAIDTKKNVAVGIKLPFGSKPIFHLNYTTYDQMKTNLISFLMTNKGERPFNPEFGANLRSFVFEQVTSTDELREILTDKIALFFPEISVKSIDINIENDLNKISISVSYVMNKIEDSLVIQLQ
jgi:phage baseplate assembly protein W